MMQGSLAIPKEATSCLRENQSPALNQHSPLCICNDTRIC